MKRWWSGWANSAARPRSTRTSAATTGPSVTRVLLAGGGVKRGYIHGASDKHGAYPDRDPVRPDDLAATMFHLLGINPETEVRDTLNRPLPIAAGKPIYGVMA